MKWKHIIWTVVLLTAIPAIFEKKQIGTTDLEENFAYGVLL